MREEYDLRGAERGAVITETGKRRITILLDSDVLAAFRGRAAGTGRGYQTLINQALRDFLAHSELEDTLRRVMREELHKAGSPVAGSAGHPRARGSHGMRRSACVTRREWPGGATPLELPGPPTARFTPPLPRLLPPPEPRRT